MSATDQSIGFTYNPDRWEESILCERFLYPYCTSEEAQMFRALGRYIFFRALEYNTTPDRGEARILADLRGAARDMRLLYRFVHNIGSGFDVTEVRPEDRQYVLHAAAIAPKLEALTRSLESLMSPPPSPDLPAPLDAPMTSERRKVVKAIRRDWEGELERRRQCGTEAEAQIEQALAEMRLIDELLSRPDTAE